MRWTTSGAAWQSSEGVPDCLAAASSAKAIGAGPGSLRGHGEDSTSWAMGHQSAPKRAELGRVQDNSRSLSGLFLLSVTSSEC
jgi:hypothetical protein